MEKFPEDNFDNQNILETKSEEGKILRVENTLKEVLPYDELLKIFGPRTYLIGGSVRDVILDKSISGSDFDLMTRSSLEEILTNLHELGFTETEEEKFSEGKFSVKKGVGIINLLIKGREIQVGIIGEKDIEELISTGDVNLNCCVFDINIQNIVNRDKFNEILDKELTFCNPELAKNDPMKIIAALKQISRLPDLKISDETMEIIESSIQMVIDFFIKNPDRKYKLESIFGSINSGQIYKLFDGYDTKDIFNGINRKRLKMNTSESYISSTIDELDSETRDKINSLIIAQFVKRLKSDKVFNKRVNSVVYELNDSGNVVSCAQMDGERMYAVASIDSDHMIRMVSDLINYNYNVWTTITATHKYLIDMSKTAGLKLVNDSDLIEKILLNNYPEYSGRIITEIKGDYVVFTKKDSNDVPQVLLRS